MPNFYCLLKNDIELLIGEESVKVCKFHVKSGHFKTF